MRKSVPFRVSVSVLTVLGLTLNTEAAVPPTTPVSSAISIPQIAATMLGLPLQFEANHGQMDDLAKFLARGKGYTLFLSPTKPVMVLSQQDAHVPIDDRCEEFIMALTFAQSQQGENTQVGNQTMPTPLMNAEPSLTDSVVRMKLEGVRPLTNHQRHGAIDEDYELSHREHPGQMTSPVSGVAH